MRVLDMPAENRITEMSFPTKVVFGPGALSRLPAQVERLGMKKPLVVTDAGVVKAGLAGRVYEVLARAKIAHAVFDRVEPNPTEKDVSEGLAAYRAGRVRRDHRARRRKPARRGEARPADDHPRAADLPLRRRGGRRPVREGRPPAADRDPDHRGHRLRGEPLGRGHARGHGAEDGDLQPGADAEGGDLRPGADRRAAPEADRVDGDGRVHPLPRGLRLQRLPPARRRARDRWDRAGRALARRGVRERLGPARPRRHDGRGDAGRDGLPEGPRRGARDRARAHADLRAPTTGSRTRSCSRR